MAQFYDRLTEELHSFIAEQKIFFTATAPKKGRINLSPKGIDTFRCIDDRTVRYLDSYSYIKHVLSNGLTKIETNLALIKLV